MCILKSYATRNSIGLSAVEIPVVFVSAVQKGGGRGRQKSCCSAMGLPALSLFP